MGDFVPQGTLGNVWRHFDCHDWEVLLTSDGQSPGMLLNVLQSPGWTWAKVSLVQCLRNAALAVSSEPKL